MLSLVFGIALIAVLLWDAFETIILPRTVSRRFRFAQVYFRSTWRPFARLARTISRDGRRERFLAVYGPLSLIGLLTVWALGLTLAFGLLQWAAGSALATPSGEPGFLDDLYLSGTTFFTLGLGDVHPMGRASRVLTVAEGGMGFGFLALTIAYFPILYQSFSRREVRLTLLDAWAGSPPAAAEILRRLGAGGELNALEPFLKEWEYWCSEVLEGHISYPVLAYFRSQHQHQSWVSALATMLDLCALVIAGIDGVPPWQARVTFAIARHAAVDLTQVLRAQPDAAANRLSAEELDRVRWQLEAVGLRPDHSPEADARLSDLRRSYEPFLAGLSAALLMPLPAWSHQHAMRDNWQTSPRIDGAHL